MSKSKLLSTVYQAAEGRRQCNMALRNKLAKNNEIDGISNLEDIALKIIISNKCNNKNIDKIISHLRSPTKITEIFLKGDDLSYEHLIHLQKNTKKKKGKSKSKNYRSYITALGNDINKNLAKKLYSLEEKKIPSLSEICYFLNMNKFTVKYAKKAIKKYSNKSLKKLPLESILDQFYSHFSDSITPTEMQFCLNNYLNSNENVNALLRAPTGSGKSSGIVAVQSNVSNSCLIFSPMSTNAWQSLVKELMPHVPYMTVTKEKNVVEFVPNWETMGRISGDKPKKFAEAVLKLREIKKANTSIRNRRKKNNVFATFPRVILVHPDLRYNGIA